VILGQNPQNLHKIPSDLDDFWRESQNPGKKCSIPSISRFAAANDRVFLTESQAGQKTFSHAPHPTSVVRSPDRPARDAPLLSGRAPSVSAVPMIPDRRHLGSILLLGGSAAGDSAVLEESTRGAGGLVVGVWGLCRLRGSGGLVVGAWGLCRLEPRTLVFGALLGSNVEECADSGEREIGDSCEREIRAVGVILSPTGKS